VLPWIAVLALVTAALTSARPYLDDVHFALAYLLVVLGASARDGRRAGLIVALASFLSFNFFLIPPYYTLAVADRLDWLVLLVFVVTASIASQLLHRAERLASEAEHAAALREADRLKDALLASMSHDLRTPLTTIKGLAHEIRITGDERAAVIEQEADRLNRLVGDLLDLSKLDGGALRLRPELNAADDLLGTALDQLAGSPRYHAISARIEGDEPLFGRFDFTHSLRALVNVLENALKYSPPDGSVEVVVTREQDDLVIRVLDRGPGIPARHAAEIFDPFFRSAGTATDVGGSGLGLAIARRFLDAQEGSIEFSPRPGGGSVFTLRLPAVDSRTVSLAD
jgi:K+-sensing histidine kinase KdpD